MNFKDEFPILQERKISYLDSGATTQKPQCVIDAIESYYKECNANPHRGAYSLSIEATEKYESTREKIAKFINARNREEIIFSKNATEIEDRKLATFNECGTANEYTKLVDAIFSLWRTDFLNASSL